MSLRCMVGILLLAGCTAIPSTPRDAGPADALGDRGTDVPRAADITDVIDVVDVAIDVADVPDASTADTGAADVLDASAIDASSADIVDVTTIDTNAIDIVDVPSVDTSVADVADVAPAEAGAADSGPRCTLTMCGSACVDVQTDPDNCRTCGRVCGSNNICVGGECRMPAVYAMHPPIADRNTGTVHIEGAFGPTATVSFPGVTSPVTARVLGPSRIEVAIPAGATGGNLTVITRGVTTEALRFRRTSFGLDLQPFRARYEQADYARQTPSLLVPRVDASAVHTGSWLYVIGGADGTGAPQASIERAMVNADGTLGAFQSTSGVLGTSRSGAASVRIGSAIFVIGGQGSSGPLDRVEQATVDASGVLSGFIPASGTLAVARSGHVAEVIGGYVYVFGGNTDVVERSAIGLSGLGPWQAVSGVRTGARRRRATVQVTGGYVYLMGGIDGTTPLASIERAAIRADGSIGAFETVDDLAGGARIGASSRVIGNRLYVAGGSNGSTALDTVEVAEIEADGSLRAFALQGPSRRLSARRQGAVSAIVGNYWYLVGGAGTSALPTIDRAEINGTGDLVGARTVPGLLEQRNSGIAVAIGPYVYMIGGGGPGGIDRHMERALVGLDGSIGRFARFNPPGGDGVTSEGPAVAVIGSTLFVIAGRTGALTYPGAMRSFPILNDGNLGAGTSALAPQLDFAWGRSFVLDNRLCIFGGNNASAQSNVVHCAGIQASGGLDAFVAQSTRLPRALSLLLGAVIGDQILLLGGANGTGTEQTVIRCPLSSGSLNCSFTPDRLIRTRSGLSGFVVGGRLVVAGGINPGAMVWNDLERAPITEAVIPGTFATVPDLLLPSPLAAHAALVIDNSAWLMGGYDGLSYLSTNIQIDLR